MSVNLTNIKQAARRIAKKIHKTPVLTCKAINEIAGANLFFKCENFQKTGSFKIRGATNAVFSLSDEEAKNGVITHSSGNHGAALAQAAAWRGIKCYVVTPHLSPQIKKDALFSYGAEVTFSDAMLSSRIAETEKIIKKTNAKLIHPYDNDVIITGAATSALELIEEKGEFDFIFAPVGGGGGISGSALAAKYLLPNVNVIGGEPELANDAFLSYTTGKLHPQLPPKTIADGLRTALSQRTFEYIQDFVDEIVVVSDQEIIEAMQLVWQRMKIIIEPSSATPLAAVLKIKEKLAGKKIGIIISGGNVDLKEILSLF
ncbi:MAG: pyridoxal-phosphate dependent enzyme [Calditrichaeota bacterium]|nr:MAG: pyridoxal-phosphate dependent enzyme [Calditrichota bacterium]MBL1207807.1 pyridoxal-phosphate dependent enzyme [Calditrichota bacterium]NOG47641.1 pyridoxal-phosphate dependent enzyme [Calditrichota bacterium]